MKVHLATRKEKTLIVLVVGILAALALFRPFSSGDTFDLIEGAKLIHSCALSGNLSNCRGYSQSVNSSVDTGGLRFPLLHYLPTVVPTVLKISSTATMRVIVVLNFLIFMFMLGLFRRSLKKYSQPLKELSTLVLVTGPLIYYARHSLSEMQAAFIILLYTLFCVGNRHWGLILLSGFLAAISKETALPFLMLLAFLVTSSWRSRSVAFFGGALGALANLLFNFFKFGTWHDPDLSNSFFYVPDLFTKIKFSLALWFSPAGGFIFFWPTFVFMMGWITWRTFKKNEKVALKIKLGGVCVVLLGLTLGFANWWSPFGWIALGPRLMLPWIPSILFLFFYFYPQTMEDGLSFLKKRKVSPVLVAFVIFLLTVPAFIPVVKPDALSVLLDSPRECPESFHPAANLERYYYCIDLVMWPEFGVPLLNLYKALVRPEFLVPALVYLIFIQTLIRRII